MTKNTSFKFKQFEVKQDKCAMKIGTDGVLLGAWASIKNNPFSILDIGAGTGIISLMLAQRCDAVPIDIGIIDAIEIDDTTYEQCVENFEESPWGDRLFCYHASLKEFVQEVDDKYDLIISNPPFYSSDYKSKNDQRDLARFQDALPFEELIESVSKLLDPNGVFCVVIPYSEETTFIDLAFKSKLYPISILHTKGNPSSEIKRSLITFSFNPPQQNTPVTDTLIIETKRHEYTPDYINLTRDFYLKM